MFDLEFQGRRSMAQCFHIFEFPDNVLVIVDTKHKFLWHTTRAIMNVLSYIQPHIQWYEGGNSTTAEEVSRF